MSYGVSCVDDLELYAQKKLDPLLFRFYQAGADEEITLRRNRQCFQNLLIRPEILTQSVENIDLSVSLIGGKFKLKYPIGFSPTGFPANIHSDAELNSSRACAKFGGLMTLAGWSNYSMERIKPEMGDAALWQNIQLYPREYKTFELIKRAEKAGVDALVMGVDATAAGQKRNFPNSKSDDFKKLIVGGPLGHFTREELDIFWGAGYPTATWDYFERVCKSTKLPVIAKGIITGKDARNAIKHGASAIWVSNHGGRLLGSFPSTIEMLPEIVAEVNGECDVYMDGGIRNGMDIFKALALGAKAVFLGRPVLWGMAYDGQKGVEKVIEMLTKELETTMKLAGCVNLEQINEKKIIKVCQCSKL